ncbi:MAG: rhodanese-like domain-containing protein [Pyrinomonadaceae bacterium]|nr:rhodanese-like domain-containing protein [Pyrinomonadaceae bacterium]
MRLLISSVLASFALFALIACHSADSSSRVASSATPATAVKPGATPAAAAPSDGARRISRIEVQDLISKGQAYIVDVRNDQAYNTAHIRGAKLIPYDQIVARSKELPSDKTIVTYCSCANEHTAAGAVLELKKKGIENAAALLGGMDGWRNAGLPVDSVK